MIVPILCLTDGSSFFVFECLKKQKQNKTKQNKTRQDKTKQNKTKTKQKKKNRNLPLHDVILWVVFQNINQALEIEFFLAVEHPFLLVLEPCCLESTSQIICPFPLT